MTQLQLNLIIARAAWSGVRFSLSQIPSGEAGTDRTVKAIANLVNDSLRRPLVRLKAINILKSANVPNKNTVAAAKALFEYVRKLVRYIPDPIDVETVQSPEVTLRVAAGDCDDHTALVAALAMSIGIPARYRVVGFASDKFAHIFPELQINGKWIPADTTSGKSFGRRVKKFPAEKLYHFKGEPVMGIGLGAPVRTLGVKRRTLQRAAYRGAMAVLKRNWNNSKINRTDVKSYLTVIDQGNSPARGTFAEAHMRKAISDFLARVMKLNVFSGKPEGSLNGLEGLGGFLKSVWSGVKKAVGAAVNIATKGASGAVGDFIGPPDPNQQRAPINFSVIRTETPPAAVKAGVAEFLTSPTVLAVAAVAAFVVLRK